MIIIMIVQALNKKPQYKTLFLLFHLKVYSDNLQVAL